MMWLLKNKFYDNMISIEYAYEGHMKSQWLTKIASLNVFKRDIFNIFSLGVGPVEPLWN